MMVEGLPLRVSRSSLLASARCTSGLRCSDLEPRPDVRTVGPRLNRIHGAATEASGLEISQGGFSQGGFPHSLFLAAQSWHAEISAGGTEREGRPELSPDALSPSRRDPRAP